MHPAIDEKRVIGSLWGTYQEEVLKGVDIPKNGMKMLKQSFYASAIALFNYILECMDPEEEPTEKDLQRMDWINEEINEYLKLVHKEIEEFHNNPNASNKLQ